MLVNVGQNAVKCLHAWDMLPDLFSQHNTFICSTLQATGLACALYFSI